MIAGRLQGTAKFGRCDAHDFSESCGKGGRRLVPDRERDVCYRQLRIHQKCLGSLDTLRGQPLVGRMAGRYAERRAEMETTTIYEGSQILETDLLIQMIAHIGGHAFDLPIGQPTALRRSGQDAARGMNSDELHAEKVDGLLHEKPGGWVTPRRLVTEEL